MKQQRRPVTSLIRTLPLATALALAPAAGLWAQDGGRNTSQLITLETNEKPLSIVLQWISRRAGINIVSNEPEQPLITMRLTNVTWQEAIEQIAERYDMVIEKRSDRIWELTKPPRVRMRFRDASLTVVLEALARHAGVNIVISDDVDGSRRLTMSLNGVPWREALNVIVKATGYTWVEHNYDIIRVVSQANIIQDLQTRIYQLNYANGAEISGSLAPALSGDGQVVHDVRTNSLIITDTPENIDSALSLLKKLDQRTREVQMEIKFVDFSTEDANKLGVSNAGITMDLDGLGTFSNVFTPFAANGGVWDNTVAYPGGRPGSNRTSSPDTDLVSGNFTFEAISQLTTSEVIQAPTILTLNNTEALIKVGKEIHFAESTTTFEDGDAITTLAEAESSPIEDGIEIRVTPTITGDGFVSIDLFASDTLNNLVTFSAGGGPNAATIQLPELNKKEVQTKIMVADGETAVIGGILTNIVDETESQVPGLGGIPLLGWLFKGKRDTVSQRNLNIFITPRIVQLSQSDELEEAKLRLRERISGLQLRPKEGEGDLPAVDR